MLYCHARGHRSLQGSMFVRSLSHEYTNNAQPQMFGKHFITWLIVHQHCLTTLLSSAFNVFVSYLNENDAIHLGN